MSDISETPVSQRYKKIDFEKLGKKQDIILAEAAVLNEINEDSFHRVSPLVTDVFQELGNYDIKFDFDPFSVDDCRCNNVSAREINVLCSLKHVPLHALIIEESDLPGGVKLKVKDDFVQRFDEVSWDDFITTTTDGRFLDPTKVHQIFLDALIFAVGEVQANTTNASIAIFKASSAISLRFRFSPEDDYYKVNLFPSIRATHSCANYQNLLKIFSSVPKTVLRECRVEQGIHVVAKPAAVDSQEDSFWSITFNDIEKRVVLSERFECAKDALHCLNDKLTNTLSQGKQLSHYQIRAFVLLEIFRKPDAKAWMRTRLQKRVAGVLKSLEIGLQKGRCPHVFTGVNLFAGMTQEVLQEISSGISEYCDIRHR
ncbi:uncharacterized protein LOC114515990 [Dendronephthya gigantea]|uniref:uncharacterized protein LOC114515990 n=1 Tax=Dendronephthya gigantea TaxID=151771 RepID=UPI001069B27E|nr:uncharacterized protein LOC114515990 [Dendronephthya gigantea]